MCCRPAKAIHRMNSSYEFRRLASINRADAISKSQGTKSIFVVVFFFVRQLVAGSVRHYPGGEAGGWWPGERQSNHQNLVIIMKSIDFQSSHYTRVCEV